MYKLYINKNVIALSFPFPKGFTPYTQSLVIIHTHVKVNIQDKSSHQPQQAHLLLSTGHLHARGS